MKRVVIFIFILLNVLSFSDTFNDNEDEGREINLNEIL